MKGGENGAGAASFLSLRVRSLRLMAALCTSVVFIYLVAP